MISCPVCQKSVALTEKGLVSVHDISNYRGGKKTCYGSFMPMPIPTKETLYSEGTGGELLDIPYEDLEVTARISKIKWGTSNLISEPADWWS